MCLLLKFCDCAPENGDFAVVSSKGAFFLWGGHETAGGQIHEQQGLKGNGL